MAARINGAGFSMLSEAPSQRIELARICVIGAGYNKEDMDRWSQIDPNYIGLSGNDTRPDLIDDPVKRDAKDWNTTLFLRSFGSGGPLGDKKFDIVFIDRRTLGWMETFTFIDLIETLLASGTTSKLYLHKRDVNAATQDYDTHMKTSRSLMAMGYERHWKEEQFHRMHSHAAYIMERFSIMNISENITVVDTKYDVSDIFVGFNMSDVQVTIQGYAF